MSTPGDSSPEAEELPDRIFDEERPGPQPRRWVKLVLKIGFCSIAFLLLACLFAPLLLRSRKNADRTQATNNARQLGMALLDFKAEYGRFPDETTIAEVKRRTDNDWDLKSETSNDLLKQLIVAGITQSEEMFYSRGEGSRKADNVTSSEARALSPGECGFAYLPPGAPLEGLSPGRPLAVAPLIRGTTRFDRAALEGKVVVLRLDNAIQAYPIGKDGRVMVNGKDLFDPSQSFWGGATPVIKWPEAKTFKTP